jgi:hypothetical protein
MFVTSEQCSFCGFGTRTTRPPRRGYARAVLIMAVCAALVAAGVVQVVRSGGAEAPPRSRLRHVAVCLAAGGLGGVIAAGAGGRLVMRLLAVTSDVNGAVTEAEARVGEITFTGTLGVLLFVGVPAGVLAGLLYALIGPLLPRGRAGGVALGGILLVLAGASLEPFRTENFDFNLVGPDWLSVLSFTALALFQGMLVVALAGTPPRLAPRPELYGRLATAALVLVALPGFAVAIGDILSG